MYFYHVPTRIQSLLLSSSFSSSSSSFFFAFVVSIIVLPLLLLFSFLLPYSIATLLSTPTSPRIIIPSNIEYQVRVRVVILLNNNLKYFFFFFFLLLLATTTNSFIYYTTGSIYLFLLKSEFDRKSMMV